MIRYDADSSPGISTSKRPTSSSIMSIWKHRALQIIADLGDID